MPRKKRTPVVNQDAGLSPGLSPTTDTPCPRCGYPKGHAGADCARCEAPPEIILANPAAAPNSTTAIFQRIGAASTKGR